MNVHLQICITKENSKFNEISHKNRMFFICSTSIRLDMRTRLQSIFFCFQYFKLCHISINRWDWIVFRADNQNIAKPVSICIHVKWKPYWLIFQFVWWSVLTLFWNFFKSSWKKKRKKIKPGWEKPRALVWPFHHLHYHSEIRTIKMVITNKFLISSNGLKIQDSKSLMQRRNFAFSTRKTSQQLLSP